MELVFRMLRVLKETFPSIPNDMNVIKWDHELWIA